MADAGLHLGPTAVKVLGSSLVPLLVHAVADTAPPMVVHAATTVIGHLSESTHNQHVLCGVEGLVEALGVHALPAWSSTVRVNVLNTLTNLALEDHNKMAVSAVGAHAVQCLQPGDDAVCEAAADLFSMLSRHPPTHPTLARLGVVERAVSLFPSSTTTTRCHLALTLAYLAKHQRTPHHTPSPSDAHPAHHAPPVPVPVPVPESAVSRDLVCGLLALCARTSRGARESGSYALYHLVRAHGGGKLVGVAEAVPTLEGTVREGSAKARLYASLTFLLLFKEHPDQANLLSPIERVVGIVGESGQARHSDHHAQDKDKGEGEGEGEAHRGLGDRGCEHRLCEALTSCPPALARLVHALQRGSLQQKMLAAYALELLGSERSRLPALVAVPGLLNALVSLVDSDNDALIVPAALALERLTALEKARVEMGRFLTAIGALHSLLERGVAVDSALTTLCHMASQPVNRAAMLSYPHMLASLCDLVASGSGRVRERALLAIAHLAGSPDSNGNESSLELPADFPALVAGICTGGRPKEVEAACLLVRNLSALERFKAVLCDNDSGLLPALTTTLSRAAPTSQTLAAQALLNLIVQPANKHALSAIPNSLECVLRVLANTSKGKLQDATVWVLALLLESQANVDKVVSLPDALLGVEQCLRTGSDNAKEGAFWILCAVVRTPAGQALAANDSTLGAIVSAMGEDEKGTSSGFHLALNVVLMLVSNLHYKPAIERQSALLPSLVVGLGQKGVVGEKCAAVVAHLALSPDVAVDLVSVPGCVEGLVELMRGGTDNGKENAVVAVGILATKPALKQLVAHTPGMLQTLAHLVAHGRPSLREKATVARANLAEANAVGLSQSPHSDVTSLVEQLDGEDSKAWHELIAMAESARHQIAMGQSKELLGTLVRTLGEGSDTAKHHTAELLRRLAKHPSNATRLVDKEGLVAGLVQLLVVGVPAVVEAAADTLAAVCSNAECQVEVASHPLALERLVGVASNGSIGGKGGKSPRGSRSPRTMQATPEARAAAMAALCAICTNPRNTKAILDTPGVTDVLASCLRETSPRKGPNTALVALSTLSHDHQLRLMLARKDEILEALVRVLGSNNRGAVEHAAATLASLSENDESKIGITDVAGVWGAVDACLRNGDEVVKEHCARVVFNLTREKETQVIVCGRPGILNGLSSLLLGGTEQAKVHAARTLCNLSLNKDISKGTLAAVPNLLEGLCALLVPDDGDGVGAGAWQRVVAEAAAQTLSVLALDRTIRRQLSDLPGAMQGLALLLHSGNTACREHAARALGNVATDRLGQLAISSTPWAVDGLVKLATAADGGEDAAQLRMLAQGALARLGAAADAQPRDKFPLPVPHTSAVPSRCASIGEPQGGVLVDGATRARRSLSMGAELAQPRAATPVRARPDASRAGVGAGQAGVGARWEGHHYSGQVG